MATLAEFRESCHRIPGGCSTAAKSPVRNRRPVGPYFAAQAKGGRFTDDEGREWLDFDMAMSAVILGHTNSRVDGAAIRQIRQGITFPVPSAMEAQLAEQLHDRFNVAERVRFCKDGSDATSAAVRIARSATGRSKIVAATYHGWHDWSAIHHYAVDRSGYRRLGIPLGIGLDTVWLPEQTFARFQATVRSDPGIAGIVVCPENWISEDLACLADYCRERHLILIFDEIKSGLRYGPRGVTGSVNVTPDLLCLGKSIANGYPLAVLAGRADMMALSVDVEFSTTAASELASLAAASAVDSYLRSVAGWPPWQRRCEEIMTTLRGCLSKLPEENRLALSGYPGNFRLHVPNCSPRNDPFQPTLVRTLARHGIFSAGYIAACAAHRAADFVRLEEALTKAIKKWNSRVRSSKPSAYEEPR